MSNDQITLSRYATQPQRSVRKHTTPLGEWIAHNYRNNNSNNNRCGRQNKFQLSDMVPSTEQSQARHSNRNSNSEGVPARESWRDNEP